MENSSKPSPAPLWTRDFTILTLGTVVSMLGNAVAGFAIGLIVLDYTESVFLYALFMVCYCLPKIILPLFAGPYLDRFSRKRAIYTFDFISCFLYLVTFVLLSFDYFNYPVFVLFAMLVGGIDSMYTVAYDSFYPALIPAGCFTKAYSISSLIFPLANTIMVPIAAVCYQTVGLAPLFLFNAVTFFIAAVAETQIKAPEQYTSERRAEPFSAGRFQKDFREGVGYLKKERGLLTITEYFFVTMLASGMAETLLLPYFRSIGKLDQYAVVMAVCTVGRLIGGVVHYRFRYPTNKKFLIAVFVYIAICVLEGSYLFLPYGLMILFNLLIGVLGVTSYNIRLSSTQNYVPDAVRGRFNGIFQMANMAGSILGQLAAGALGDVLPMRIVVAGSMALNILGVFVVLLPGRAGVKMIYNTEN